MSEGIFYGEVKDGVLHLDRKEVYNTWIVTLNNKRVYIKIEEEARKSTVDQFEYLYACIYTPMAEFTGYSVEEVDGMFKKRHLTKFKGTKKEYVREKAKLSKKELAKFIDDCIMTCAEVGVVVLPPDKFWKNKK